MSVKEHVYITDLHFEHNVWKNELAFYKEEIGIFEDRLGEISQRWTDTDVMAQLERFQNQYIREREVIDILNHDINRRQQALVEFAKDHPIALDHIHFQDHEDMRNRMETFRKIYGELKNDFLAFIRKYL